MARSSSRTGLFWGINLLITAGGITLGYFFSESTDLDILPIITETRNHADSLRHPGVFREAHSDSASKAALVFNEDGTFNFDYEKSEHMSHPFAGLWFPLENVEIDFSKYTRIEIGIEPLTQ